MDNDQDKLLKDFQDLEENFNETDRNIESLAEEVREYEKEIQEDDEETELSKFMKKRELRKNTIIFDLLVLQCSPWRELYGLRLNSFKVEERKSC